MKKVWMATDCVLSPLGSTTEENFSNIQKGLSGIRQINETALSATPFFASSIQNLTLEPGKTRFETMCSHVIRHVLNDVSLSSERTIFILATTKGNISLLEENQPDHPRIALHTTAAGLADQFKLKHHLVVSNACISGVMAMLVARRMIQGNQYDHAIVVGADVLSKFVISGFQSLQALSYEPCRPFDENRIGITLGECAAATILTSKPERFPMPPSILIQGGGLSNDANHISGPSRTGQELSFAVRDALKEACLSADEIDFISAHGTATLYNDEMEAKAFNLLGMSTTPLNSLKGYFGHTLGAAGVLESVMSAQSLIHQELVATKGFRALGVTMPLHVIQSSEKKTMKTCLKTSSGFGGCNAALLLQNQTNQ
jgi:3-oxoacyl-[acyl-carrier-protein] synthase I